MRADDSVSKLGDCAEVWLRWRPAWQWVLPMGDSTLLGVLRYDAFEAVQGLESVSDAQSCRTLGVPSCGDEPRLRVRPTNSVEAIGSAPGRFDTIMIMAGYDESRTSFSSSFDAVLAASRAKGATRILWLTNCESAGLTAPGGATANEAFGEEQPDVTGQGGVGERSPMWCSPAGSVPRDQPPAAADDGIHLTGPGARTPNLCGPVTDIRSTFPCRACPTPPCPAQVLSRFGNCATPRCDDGRMGGEATVDVDVDVDVDVVVDVEDLLRALASLAVEYLTVLDRDWLKSQLVVLARDGRG